jgi:hypothetical protein
MTSGIVNVCFDPRLNHDAIRQQVRERAAEPRPASSSIFVIGDAGGNFGSGARNLIALFARQREPIAVAALLHHDDCKAAAAGMRHDLAASAKAFQEALRAAGYEVPVLTGTVVSETSAVIWTDRPSPTSEVSTFRMPRMYGG